MRLKLVMPFLYATITLIFFVLSWPISAQMHHYVGILITIVSFILWIIARVQLGNAFSIDAKAQRLVTRGLYSKLRHPVYYFSILAVVGVGIYLWNVYIFIPIALLVCLEMYRLKKEEGVLYEKFGKDYTRYKANTWF